MKKKIVIGLILGVLVASAFIYVSHMQKEEQQRILEETALKEITDRFNTTVVTNKEAILYQLEQDDYNESGRIASGYPLQLEEQPITKDTTHFKIANFDAYIHINDVDPTDWIPEKDSAYTRYVVFNESVQTSSPTHFYNEADEAVLTLNASFDFPIIIKEEGKVGIEFDDTLYYVKDLERTYASDNTDTQTRSNIRTFTYHTVYDKQTQSCTSVEICHPIEQFDEQMKYLHDNDFVTLSMEELELFLDDKIRVPLKTVVVTLDDGIFLENSIPLVEKYKVNATFFIITSRADVTPYMDSSYARFESHTDDLHNNYRCPKNTSYSQGGQLLCEDADKVRADLKLSQEKLQGSNYFAYPFFDFNDRAKTLLKETGFHLAFIGQYTSNGYSDRNTEKMMIRRTTIFGNYSLDTFTDYCNDRD